MKIESMHVGMKVRHPDYGVGSVKSVSEHLADIRFDSGLRTLSPEQSELSPAEAQAEVTGLSMPLSALISEIAASITKNLGIERDDSIVEDLAARWQKGTLVLRPSDPGLQSKEVPIEAFFHKIVMMRNNLRVLEQKINGHPQLSDARSSRCSNTFSRCYGSMTTFNLLFKSESGQFKSKG